MHWKEERDGGESKGVLSEGSEGVSKRVMSAKEKRKESSDGGVGRRKGEK